ncbi:MAG TPA: GNAT family N-acetyltransferase [Phycisphaerales bacterium]|nr:GNAT family N-acetyltransferase [Phycisphaerales bacterium]
MPRRSRKTNEPIEFRLRRLRASDYPAVVELQHRCFPGMIPWSREQIESQLKLFPEGQIVLVAGKKIIGSSSSLIVSFDHYSAWSDWKAITDHGMIRNHDPTGDTLYGMEIMIDPDFRGLKLSRRLYDARKDLAKELNLRRIIIGGRIPGYGKHAKRMSADQYVERVRRKQLVDPVLTPQTSNGFVLKGLLPNYLPKDLESAGYATFLEWTNPDYKIQGVARSHQTAQIRLCLVQYLMRRVKSFAEFEAIVANFVDLSSDYRSDFILFPELFSTQLLSIMKPERPGAAARSLARFAPRLNEMFSRLAVRHNVNIINGSHFAIEGEHLYNVASIYRRNGTASHQKKIQITPNERKWWGVSPGNDLGVFETDRGKIGVLVCYDIEFPELSRILAAKGANIIFVPFNTDERYGYLRVRHCAQARAIENQLYVAIAGCAGLMPGVPNADLHYSQLGIFTPSDFPFARDALASESMPNIETVIVHDVDVELLRRNRLEGTARPFSDRRRDLYSVVANLGTGREEI